MTAKTQKFLNNTGLIYVIGFVVFAGMWMTQMLRRNRVRGQI